VPGAAAVPGGVAPAAELVVPPGVTTSVVAGAEGDACSSAGSALHGAVSLVLILVDLISVW
jgi:hypothetical protein